MSSTQPAETEPRTFTWTVEFTVSENWVADGFDLTDERAHRMLANDLAYAYGHELQAKVLTSPNRAAIRRAQGYTDDANVLARTRASQLPTRVILWAKPNQVVGIRLLGARGYATEIPEKFDSALGAWLIYTSATVDEVREVFAHRLTAFDVEVTHA